MGLKSFISLVKGSFGLFLFIKGINDLVSFSTTSFQRKKIIIYLVKTTLLVEKAFDIGILNTHNFRELILGEKKIDSSSLRKIKRNLELIKFLSNGSHYEVFFKYFLKTWETHKIRDSKQKNVLDISSKEALKSSEERGGFYFLSLIYALDPLYFDEFLKEVIFLSGSWFQIIDDYADRKKDKGKKNTIFTVSNENPKYLFKENIERYHNQLQILLKHKGNFLILFMRTLSNLWPLSYYVPFFDWHN